MSVDWHYFIRDPFCFASLVILAYLIKRCAIRDGKSQFSVLQLFYIIIRVTIKLGFSDIEDSGKILRLFDYFRL